LEGRRPGGCPAALGPVLRAVITGNEPLFASWF
jgi:hypothetical protein